MRPLSPRSSTTSRSSPPPPPFPLLSPVTPISPWPPQTAEPHSEPLPSAKEVYGFITVLLTYFGFGLYLVWAFCPVEWLALIGWTWYPNQDWAIIVPSWLMIIIILTYWSYASLSAFLTPPWSSNKFMTIHRSEPREYYWKFSQSDAIPEAIDLPIDLVNRTLYPPRKRRSAHSDEL